MRRRQFISLLGGAAALLRPPELEAQETAPQHRVAFLALVPGEDRTLLPALIGRLRELGYSEGRNMTLAYRSAEGHPERLPALAAELIDGRPDVLVAGFGTLAARAAKTATGTVPVVFVTVGDPLGAGIVASLARPGDNVTGLTDQARDVQGKRLQLLLELVTNKREIAALLNPDTPFSRLALEEAQAAPGASPSAGARSDNGRCNRGADRGGGEDVGRRSAHPRRSADLQHSGKNSRACGAPAPAHHVRVQGFRPKREA
jgi:putative ABC transport system substrate-binding protein